MPLTLTDILPPAALGNYHPGNRAVPITEVRFDDMMDCAVYLENGIGVWVFASEADPAHLIQMLSAAQVPTNFHDMGFKLSEWAPWADDDDAE